MHMAIFKHLATELDSIQARDPAARSRLEVFLTYPGVHALLYYRVSNWLWKKGFFTLARVISQFARWLTGIEIHPGARIGRNLFIDHGMGVVIGETAEIGDEVTLYHGVTLGGVTPSVNSASQINKKRHPTLKDHVIVGAGAQILGPITVEEGARVGANAVVLADVPAGVLVVGIPAKVAGKRVRPAEFAAYGLAGGDLADPVMRAVEGLMEEVHRLQERLGTLETEQTNKDEEKKNVDSLPISSLSSITRGDRP